MSKSQQKRVHAQTEKLSGTIRCPKCDGAMKPGFALATTFITGVPDTLRTMSPGGPGRQIKVMKCRKCGHSEA